MQQPEYWSAKLANLASINFIGKTNITNKSCWQVLQLRGSLRCCNPILTADAGKVLPAVSRCNHCYRGGLIYDSAHIPEYVAASTYKITENMYIVHTCMTYVGICLVLHVPHCWNVGECAQSSHWGHIPLKDLPGFRLHKVIVIRVQLLMCRRDLEKGLHSEDCWGEAELHECAPHFRLLEAVGRTAMVGSLETHMVIQTAVRNACTALWLLFFLWLPLRRLEKGCLSWRSVSGRSEYTLHAS